MKISPSTGIIRSTSQSVSLPPLMPTPGRQTSAAESQKASSTAVRSEKARTTTSARQSRRLSAMRHRGHPRLAQQSVDDHHGATRFETEVHSMQALRPQCFGDLVLVLTLAVEEEEATATGAGDLAAPGTRVPGHLIPLIDPGIGDAGGQLTLGHPGLVQVIAERADVTADQVVAKRDRHRLVHMQRLDHAGAVAFAAALLLAQDLGRIARAAREEEHQASFELRLQLIRQAERLDHDAVGIELNEVQAAEAGRVLVLLADRHFEPVDLDLAGEVGDLLPVHAHVAQHRHRLDQRHRDGAGRSEPGARRYLRGEEEGEAGPDSEVLDDHLGKVEVTVPDRRSLERMPVEGPVIGGGNLDVVAVVKGEDHVEVLVDRRADDRPAILGVIGLQVGTATRQAEPERGPGDQHGTAPTAADRSRQSLTASGRPLTATTSGATPAATSVINTGRHPAARAASTYVGPSPTLHESDSRMPSSALAR